MIRRMTIFAIGFLLVAASVQAQTDKSSTRIERQHKYTHFQKGQMKQTEASILNAIEGESASVQQASIQTLRDLEQLVPDYPFASLITPLAKLLKGEQTDRVVRSLAALALDELHSEAGDKAIKDVAEKCDDKGVQSLCEALLVRSNLN